MKPENNKSIDPNIKMVKEVKRQAKLEELEKIDKYYHTLDKRKIAEDPLQHIADLYANLEELRKQLYN